MYIGLDQSTVATGVAIYNAAARRIVTFVVKPDGEADYYVRVLHLTTVLNQLIDLLEPEWLFLEQPYNRKGRTNGNTFMQLAGLMVTLGVTATARGIKHRTLKVGSNNDSWAKTLGSKGTKAVWRALIPHCPAEASIDQSDAIGVLWAGLVQEGITTKEELQTTAIKHIEYTNVTARSNDKRRAKASQFYSELLEAIGIREVP